jgi:hypothetical protein
MRKPPVRRALRVLRAVGTQLPWVPPGHFYSPLTSPADIARALAQPPVTDLVDVRAAAQEALVAEIGPLWSEFPAGTRWSGGPENDQFALGDAAVYASMLRHLRPRRVVEVGSGWSSAVALDVRERYGLDLDLTFIEPYTERLERLLLPSDRATAVVRQEFVQDTPLSVFAALAPGDVLFVDSSHVLKAGSDVEHLFFRVLPSLPVGVYVHVHDCFWPWQYVPSWLRAHRDWNELYLLHAYLAGNASWRVVLFNDWVWQERPALVSRYLPAAAGQRPGGIWLEKVASS